MPRKRKRILIVHGFAELTPDRFYTVRVENIDLAGEDLKVTVAHVDRLHEGRKHEILLPLPIRPSGPTAAFFQACGFADLSIGTEITYEESIGRCVRVQLDPSRSGKVTAWAPFEKEESHGE